MFTSDMKNAFLAKMNNKNQLDIFCEISILISAVNILIQ